MDWCDTGWLFVGGYLFLRLTKISTTSKPFFLERLFVLSPIIFTEPKYSTCRPK